MNNMTLEVEADAGLTKDGVDFTLFSSDYISGSTEFTFLDMFDDLIDGYTIRKGDVLCMDEDDYNHLLDIVDGMNKACNYALTSLLLYRKV